MDPVLSASLSSRQSPLLHSATPASSASPAPVGRGRGQDVLEVAIWVEVVVIAAIIIRKYHHHHHHHHHDHHHQPPAPSSSSSSSSSSPPSLCVFAMLHPDLHLSLLCSLPAAADEIYRGLLPSAGPQLHLQQCEPWPARPPSHVRMLRA